MTAADSPLAGIRVVDLTRVVSGPFATMQLADLGADVVKVEMPGTGDDARAFGPPFTGGESAYFLSVNRNKKSLALDLKQPDALAALLKLVDRTDVLVENFRPGTAERLGIGHERLAARNPRLVHAAITGFGRTGPERDRPGYDLVVQGKAGLMDVTGEADGEPMKVGCPVADLVSGLYAAQGILAALRVRDATGRGQRVDVAMLDAVASLLTYNAGAYFATGESPRRRGNRHPTIVPYAPFRAADGWLNLAVANDALWRRFCAVAGEPALADDPRFAAAPDRVRNADALLPIVERIVAGRTRDEWVAALEAAGVPVGAIRTVGEVLEGPGIAARGKVATLPHPTAGAVRMVDTPVELSACRTGARFAPPRLGEHTREVLAGWAGLGNDEIDRLVASGAAAVADG